MIFVLLIIGLGPALISDMAGTGVFFEPPVGNSSSHPFVENVVLFSLLKFYIDTILQD